MSQSVSFGKQASPVDGLLADYACGRLGAPLHALVASHIALKPQGAAFVAHLEALHGREIEAMTSVSRDEAAFHQRIVAIVEGQRVSPSARPASCAVLPAPLHAFLGRDLSEIRWRTKLPGLKEYHVETEDGLEASLLWIGAGRKMLAHTHKGSEITLVLQGAFEDINGRYQRGDITVADAEVDHAPRAGGEADCICFAVTDAPLQLTGPIGRVVSRLFGA